MEEEEAENGERIVHRREPGEIEAGTQARETKQTLTRVSEASYLAAYGRSGISWRAWQEQEDSQYFSESEEEQDKEEQDSIVEEEHMIEATNLDGWIAVVFREHAMLFAPLARVLISDGNFDNWR